MCRLLSGFSAKKSVVSLAEVVAAGLQLHCCSAALALFLGGAENGGPPLMSGCCGSPWAADRPTSGRFLAFLW